MVTWPRTTRKMKNEVRITMDKEEQHDIYLFGVILWMLKEDGFRNYQEGGQVHAAQLARFLRAAT